MTQYLHDADTIEAAAWIMFMLGSIFGIIVTRLYDRLRRPGPTPKAGFYRCQQCHWVFFLDQDGKWSSAIFDEDNRPFPGSRISEYTDEDFYYIYGDCYNHLKRIQDMVVKL